MSAIPDPRLILREEELDAALELLLLAEAALWSTADAALESEIKGLGRSHYRTLFLLKRRPGLGVQDLARLTALSKQGSSRTLGELERLGLVEKRPGKGDSRRKPAVLTAAGAAVEARVSERLRAQVARAYRTGGLDAVAGARRILTALAGARLIVGRAAEPEG
jgi:DNA-binding MarR family transcriptional regulator